MTGRAAVRRIGGVSSTAGFCAELAGTRSSMPREKHKGKETTRQRVPMRWPGADRSVVATKAL